MVQVKKIKANGFEMFQVIKNGVVLHTSWSLNGVHSWLLNQKVV